MSTVRFADLCDFPSCRTRSDEYSRHAVCRECLRDICEAHVAPGSLQDDTGRALCLGCAAEAVAQGVIAKEATC